MCATLYQKLFQHLLVYCMFTINGIGDYFMESARVVCVPVVPEAMLPVICLSVEFQMSRQSVG